MWYLGSHLIQLLLISSPHFTPTNTHDDFYSISQLNPTQVFNIVYACIRLMNGSQVCVTERTEFQCGLPEIKRIDFYSSNDRSFGQFLRESSCNMRTLCTRCQKPLISHTLQILHNGISIAVTSANVGTAKQHSDVIRVWRFVFLLIWIVVDASVVMKLLLKLYQIQHFIFPWGLSYNFSSMILLH